MDPVRLTGPRLILREFDHTQAEVAGLHAVFGDPETARYLPFEPRDLEDCADQIEQYLDAAEQRPRTEYRLAVARPADGEGAPWSAPPPSPSKATGPPSSGTRCAGTPGATGTPARSSRCSADSASTPLACTGWPPVPTRATPPRPGCSPGPVSSWRAGSGTS